MAEMPGFYQGGEYDVAGCIVGADPEGSVYSGGTGRPYLVEGVENECRREGKGIEIGGDMVTVLDEWQPGQGVDSVGIFGYKQGRDGKKTMNKASTMPMHIRWNAAERLLEYLYGNRP